MQQSFWNQPTAPHLLSTEFQFNSNNLATQHAKQDSCVCCLKLTSSGFCQNWKHFFFISTYLEEHTLWPQYFCWKTFEWIFVLRVFLTFQVKADWNSNSFLWLIEFLQEIFLVGLSTCNRLKETFKKHIVSVVSSL